MNLKKLTLAILIAASSQVFGSSFKFKSINCNPLPKDVLEAAICNSSEAIQLDQLIAKELNLRVPLCELESILLGQREFLKDRNLCSDGGNFADVQDCVIDKMQWRLEVLISEGQEGYFCAEYSPHNE